MRIERIDHDRELALCSTADGARSTVEIALVHSGERGRDAARPRRHGDRARCGERDAPMAMKYVDEYRDAELGQALAGEDPLARSSPAATTR